MPGALTPTEVLTAWESGAELVKNFPADLGGPPYLKALRGPLPQVRLMPTGGVDLDTAEGFLKAGACCLGVGRPPSEPKAIADGDFDRIRDLATKYSALVRRFRGVGITPLPMAPIPRFASGFSSRETQPEGIGHPASGRRIPDHRPARETKNLRSAFIWPSKVHSSLIASILETGLSPTIRTVWPIRFKPNAIAGR